MQKLLFCISFLFLFSSSQAENADSTWFVNNYSKKEVYITMRDGIKLFTSVYIPKDMKEKHPFLMTRTPYSSAPYGENKFIQIWHSYKMRYAREGYIFVNQDVRGRYMSNGKFEDVRPFNKNKKGTEIDEASDTYDTVDWLVKNINNNNGNVGVFGTSYPGFYSTEAALSGHPAIKAVSPQAPVTDWFMGDDFHHKGVFFQMDGFAFYPTFGKPHPAPTMNYGEGFTTDIKDNYKFYLDAGPVKNLSKMIGDSIAFWHEMYQHPNYDEWWQARNARVGLYNVKPAMLWVGGLFDAEDSYGAWNSFKATEKQSPQTNNKIVMGPWYHGQWSREGSFLGNVRFGSNTSDYYQQQIEIPFFNYYLKNEGNAPALSKANIFVTGENKWHQYSAWPPAESREETIYINADNKLSFSPLTSTAKSYTYTSDPAHPVPYTEDVHNRRTREYMTDDQRFAERRPDVLTFSMPVTEDITITGPVIADLVASITTTDADFDVKLIDVFPDNFDYANTTDSVGNGKEYPMGGYQMLVRIETMRGKFRESFSKPVPFTPGQRTHVKFEMPDVAHTFKKGHRLMIQIQSSLFPLTDRNPQTFTNIYTASEKDFKKSDISIYYGSGSQTTFTFPRIK